MLMEGSWGGGVTELNLPPLSCHRGGERMENEARSVRVMTHSGFWI